MMASEGFPALIFRGRKGSANLGVQEDGAATLMLSSKDEKSAAGLWVAKDGAPKLFLRARGKNPNLSLGIEDDGSCGLSLIDSKSTCCSNAAIQPATPAFASSPPAASAGRAR